MQRHEIPSPTRSGILHAVFSAIANFLAYNIKTEVNGDLCLQAALDGRTEALDYIGGVLKGAATHVGPR
jgi:hypothetical protein